MTVHGRKTFFLVNDQVRQNAIEMVRHAAPESVVTVTPKTRSNEQNAKIHAMLSDLARSDLTWAGKRRSMEEWKALIISGHAVATKHGGEVVPGIEGEFVAIRESSATMTVSRAASLIEYLQAFCAAHGVELRDTRYGGFTEPSAPPADAAAVSTPPAQNPMDAAATPSAADTGGDEEAGASVPVEKAAHGELSAPASEPDDEDKAKIRRMLMEECITNMLRDATSEPAAERLGKIDKGEHIWKGELPYHHGFVEKVAETARRIAAKPGDKAKARDYLLAKVA